MFTTQKNWEVEVVTVSSSRFSSAGAGVGMLHAATEFGGDFKLDLICFLLNWLVVLLSVQMTLCSPFLNCCVGPHINRLTKYRKERHMAADDKKCRRWYTLNVFHFRNMYLLSVYFRPGATLIKL